MAVRFAFISLYLNILHVVLLLTFLHIKIPCLSGEPALLKVSPAVTAAFIFKTLKILISFKSRKAADELREQVKRRDYWELNEKT